VHEGIPGNWVRDMVTNARDPASGQAYLDRRIPQIIASMPEEKASQYQLFLNWWYLYFGYLDRYFELILASELTDSSWTNAQNLVYNGVSIRRSDFMSHPKYLEVAERLGLIDIWEQRGPPDFCDKVDGEWLCE